MISKLRSALGADALEVGTSWFGTVARVTGARLVVEGLGGVGRLGDRLAVHREGEEDFLAEIIGVEDTRIIAFGFGAPDGVAAGDIAVLNRNSPFAFPSEDWLGNVLDWRGRREDGSAPANGPRKMALCAAALKAPMRKSLGARMPTGHAVFDTFLPLCRGQRLGLFAGSGVGKSSLIGSLARHIEADVTIVALIGERSREVRGFITENFDHQAMKKSIVFYSTSDQPALMKMQSAHLAMTAAEYFRTIGANVLLIVDSVTRYAQAHREVAVSGGEPPALGGYPPSTFELLAKFAERAGPGAQSAGEGDITAIFSVLVSASDMDEPIADSLRGILDGHVVLDRSIAERGRFPAIDIRRSVSRSLPHAASINQNLVLARARALLGAYEDKETIIKAGLYKAGADPDLDHAIKIWPALDAFVTRIGASTFDERFSQLSEILGEDY